MHDRIEIRLVAAGEIHAVVHEPSGATFTVRGFPLEGTTTLRLSPRVPGVHEVKIYDGGVLVKTKRFVAEGTLGHGFVRVDARDPHRLLFEDGTPFFMLGENRINVYDPTWNWNNLSIEDYLAKMAREGMTTLRVFVFTDCENEQGGRQLGCLETEIGKFDERVARDFDRIFDAAEKNGLYVIIAPWAIGFTGGDEVWKSWADNPYSKMVKTAPEFFEREDVRVAAKQKLRYILDRWGYSTHLLAIDLINEPEWDGSIRETTWIPWAEKMGADAHAMDPWHHLITAGPVGLKWNVGEGDEKPWYASKQNDVVQFHLYGKEHYDPWDLATEMTRRITEVWSFDKPVLCGGLGYGGEDPVTHDHTHVGIWSALMSGGGALSHRAPVFQIDSDEPMTPARGAHFRVLSNFMRALDHWPDPRPRHDVTARRAALGCGPYAAKTITGRSGSSARTRATEPR